MEQKKQNKFYPGIHFKAKHLNKSDLAMNIPGLWLDLIRQRDGKSTVIINKQTNHLNTDTSQAADFQTQGRLRP